MTIIHLMGKINEQGKLEVELPEGLPPSAVEVTLEILNTKDPTAWENQPWTDEELEALSKIEPKTSTQIIAVGHVGGWEDYGITDSVEWIEKQRQKRREMREW